MNENRFRMAVGLDLGAKYTGVFSTGFFIGSQPTPENSDAYTIVMPDSGDKMTYSMTNRTAVRHRLRGKKRFNMARRLAMLIIEQQLQSAKTPLTDIEHKRLIEAVFGLLKRRGYTRIESEVDLNTLGSVDVFPFAQHPVLSKYFVEGRPLAEQWENRIKKMSEVAAFHSDSQLPSIKEFEKFIAQNCPGLKKNEFSRAYKAIRDDAKNICDLQSLGHKSRTKYLEAILKDIRKDTRLLPAIDAFGSVERFYCLIGNISNLQLRAQRWYFNAPELLKGDRWEAEKLQKTLIRAFQYFHPESEDIAKHRKLIKDLQSAENIIDALCTIDPKNTVPPYEDQNNRRPPKDLTLWLSPEKLRLFYGEQWQCWAQNLIRRNPILIDGLDEILAKIDRKSRIRIRSNPQRSSSEYLHSYVLQRAFDRSKARDPYALRALAYGSASQRASAGREALSLAVGSQHVDAFIQCARRYYDEVENAKRGIWTQSEAQLLERADLHPPMKKKVLPVLVGNVLGVDPDTAVRFINEVWHFKYKGNSTVASTCAKIERIRKEYAGQFNQMYRRALQSAEKQRPLNKDEKSFCDLEKNVKDVSIAIVNQLNLDNSAIKAFGNPYSLAQLYTLIDTDRNGFSSTSLAAHLENAWRMQKDLGNDQGTEAGAQCSRLPADSVRPFDGLVRRILDREAWTVAHRTAESLKELVNFNGGLVELAVFVEDNSFNFTASVAEIKKNTTTLKKLQKESDVRARRLQSKEERIQSAARGICAYTGVPLGDGGEIDHILPRSRTSAMRGVVFNAEPNLIYVSQQGNQLKGDTRYFLENLHPNYLKAVFGTDNCQTIRQIINDTIQKLYKQKRLRYLDMLSQAEYDAVRHALFLPQGTEAFEMVMEVLETQRRSRVNGTQAFFLRNLIEKMRQELGAWMKATGNEVRFVPSLTSVVSGKRSELGKIKAEFAKPKDAAQPVASHAIDGLIAMATGLDEVLQINREQSLFDIRDNQFLVDLFPRQCDVLHVSRKDHVKKGDPASQMLFKEGIYAERFLPLFVKGGKLYVGFKNIRASLGSSSVEVTGKHPEALGQLLADFMEPAFETLDVDATYRIKSAEAFAFLNKLACSPCSDTQALQQADVLESLLYYTTRQSVKAVLLPTTSKKLVQPAEKFWKTGLKLAVGAKKDWSIKGQLLLPSSVEWYRLINDERLVARYGQEITESELVELLEDIWGRKQHRDIAHARVRREFSLPVIDNPSGGYRFKRKTINGNELYQVHAINSPDVPKAVGFGTDEHHVNWKEIVPQVRLRHENLNDCGGRYVNAVKYVSMDEYRLLIDENDVRLWMAPGSISRRYVRISAPFNKFVVWLKASNDQMDYTPAPLSLGADLKLINPSAFVAAMDENIREIAGVPRNGSIVIETVGTRVQFTYSVTSSNASMNNAYNNARQRK